MTQHKTRQLSWHAATVLFTVAGLSGCSSSGDTAVTDGAPTTTESNLDLTRFVDGALASSTIVDCELADGTATQCHELITVGTAKSNDAIGPFCPDTTSSAADVAGIWLDGSSVYEADGNFILDLPNLYGQTYPPADQWIFYDENGDVQVTDTLEGCIAAARPDVDPAYQSHCVECSLDDLEEEILSLTFLIPVTPEVATTTGSVTASTGISLNGFQIAARAPVDDILSNYTIAAFDDCGGHVNPNDGYHYHAATGADGCNSAGTEPDGHAALIGYAMDGYGIHGSLEPDSEELATLDTCNGHEDDTRGYHYHASSAESNEHIGCFRGKTVESAQVGPPPGGRTRAAEGIRGPRPDPR